MRSPMKEAIDLAYRVAAALERIEHLSDAAANILDQKPLENEKAAEREKARADSLIRAASEKASEGHELALQLGAMLEGAK